jgi:glycosyltransferase involved in cell wall biosynthesis
VATDRDSSRDNGDVTVVISCFNYGRYLLEAVESALRQSGGAPRVVVVDDGSTEHSTLEVLEGLPREVEVVRQENRGVCAARNAGLSRVETAFALVLDADDRLRPDALELLRPPLERDPTIGFTYGRMRFFGDWEGVLQFPPYDPYALLYRHTIGLSALARREVFEDTGGFDEAFLHFEDWELWLDALEHGWRGEQVDAVTVEYRKHGGSKVGQDRRHYRSAYRRLRARHAPLYARAGELAAESNLGAVGRLAYRVYWGPRPVPARLEQALHRLHFGA